jgi:hypothetical protein
LTAYPAAQSQYQLLHLLISTYENYTYDVSKEKINSLGSEPSIIIYKLPFNCNVLFSTGITQVTVEISEQTGKLGTVVINGNYVIK